VRWAVEAILTAVKTGKIADEKVFVSEVEQAIRILNAERGAEGALKSGEWSDVRCQSRGLCTVEKKIEFALMASPPQPTENPNDLA
jgi:hypothetical protein